METLSAVLGKNVVRALTYRLISPNKIFIFEGGQHIMHIFFWNSQKVQIKLRTELSKKLGGKCSGFPQ